LSIVLLKFHALRCVITYLSGAYKNSVLEEIGWVGDVRARQIELLRVAREMPRDGKLPRITHIRFLFTRAPGCYSPRAVRAPE
jgi:hypothetical protein